MKKIFLLLVLIPMFALAQTSDKNLTFTVNGVSFTMVYVKGGTYMMGGISGKGIHADTNERPVHSETVGDFWIGETEVTQALWQAVMGSNLSKFIGRNLPVEQVSWDDCQLFVKKLNHLLSGRMPRGHRFRLPDEAEWEYAARGGNCSGDYYFSGSNNIENVAWYNHNSDNSTHEVKTKNSNELGIYDMTGNVGEWCEDNWRHNYDASYISSVRVFRGGDWDTPAMSSRVSSRSRCPQNSSMGLGLRIAL